MRRGATPLGQVLGPRWRRPLTLALHVALVSLVLWGLESRLGGSQVASSAGLARDSYDFAFTGQLAFWTQTFKAVLETLAIAVLATLWGALLGSVLGMLATRSAVLRASTKRHRLSVFFARLLLDALRAIPDFGWALLLMTILGAGPITGVAALAISNAGILGRLYSEQWENMTGPARELASTGSDSRLLRFAYVHRLVFRSTNRSFTMLRLECTVRNASVIGVVGGGGLGGQIFEAFSLGQLEQALILFLTLCAVAGWTEAGSGKLIERLSGPARRGVIFAAVVLSAAWLAAPAQAIVQRLSRTDFSWVRGILARLCTPDLSPGTLVELAQECVLPLALAYVASLGATLFAYTLAFPLAHSLQQRWGWRPLTPGPTTTLRRAGASLGRWLSLIGRTLPVEASVLVFAFVWGLGWKAALAALTLHSAALLVRLFYDVLDRHAVQEIEHRGAMRRLDWWTYVVTPQLWPRWRSFVFFLADANLRSGIVLGMIGVGGIGDRFHSALSFWQLSVASSCLVCMLILSLLSDRTARWVAQRARRS